MYSGYTGAKNRRLDRRLVALAAAYAVALNILLPVLAAILPPAASGEIGSGAICSAGGAASDRGAPARPQPLCPCGAACVMPGCAATALPDCAPPLGTRAALASIGLVGPSHEGRGTPTFWPGGSKPARGPPIG
jgi:hypothetical protein